MKRALAILLVPFAVACARSGGAAAESGAVAEGATSARSTAAKKVTLLVTGDVGGKYAPCG